MILIHACILFLGGKWMQSVSQLALPFLRALHLLCESAATNINQYRTTLVENIPEIPTTEIFIPRYGLSFTPWEKWLSNENPDWWRSYNNVKHHRDMHFNEATLENALKSLGGLLVMTYHLYTLKLSEHSQVLLPAKEITNLLQPQSGLLRLHESNYYEPLIV